MSISKEIRHQLSVLARRSKSRETAFTKSTPTDWRPQTVRNPSSHLGMAFSEAEAWELITTKLEEGHSVETITLDQPKGKIGYVMKICLTKDSPSLYVKLQLQGQKVIGRSFHD